MQRAPSKIIALCLGAGLLAGCETMSDFGESTSDTVGGWFDSSAASSDGNYIARQVDGDLSEEDAAAISRAVAKALERSPAGRKVTWRNSSSGVSATLTPGSTALEKREIEAAMRRGVVATPNMVLIARGYKAARNANLRSGPGTGYKIVGGLVKGERLSALGAVGKGDWIMVALDGEVVGYVFAPLVAPDPKARAELREGAGGPTPPSGSNLVVETLVVSTSCRTVDYTVRTADGDSTEDGLRACKASDGAWEIN